MCSVVGNSFSTLNPPRPCGRGRHEKVQRVRQKDLKSTPPVWAGTEGGDKARAIYDLKSTPPVWAGTTDVVLDSQEFAP